MRPYKIDITERPKLTVDPNSRAEYPIQYPAGKEAEWATHCEVMWGRLDSFFLPSEHKIYRSRSSAREKQQVVERWGGEAAILEAEVSAFIPVEVANRRRKNARSASRIAKLQAEIERLREDCA